MSGRRRLVRSFGVAREPTQELRIGRAAVLVDVEPFELAFLGDTERAGRLDGVHE